MTKLPHELVKIIYAYKKEFETCQTRIDETVNIFLHLQSRVDGVQDDLKICGSKECRRLVRILECIVQEARRIVGNVLDAEGVSEVQEKLLQALQNDMISEIMDSNLNPFFVRIQEVSEEPPDHDGSQEYIPEIDIPLFSNF